MVGCFLSTVLMVHGPRNMPVWGAAYRVESEKRCAMSHRRCRRDDATAVVGVDLCAISEFDPERVRQALGIDIPKFEIGLQLLLVCRAQSQPRLNCLPLFQLVEYR